MNIVKFAICVRDVVRILMRVERRPLVVLAAAVLLSMPVLPVELWLLKSLVDRVQNWTANDSIRPIIIAAAWLAALMVMNNIALGVPIPISQTRLNEIGAIEQQRLILQKTARLPLTDVETPHIHNMRERAMQVSFDAIYNTALQLVQTVVQAVTLLLIMFVYGQWIPAAAVCLSAFLLAVVSGRAENKMERLTREQTADRRMLAYFAGLMTGRESAKEIRLFGLGGLLTERWNRIAGKQYAESVAAVRSSELRKLVPELLTALVSGLLVAMIVLLPGANKLTAGDFAILLLCATMLVSLLPGLIGQFVTLYRQQMRWEDFRAYMELPEDDRLNLKQPIHTVTANGADSIASGKGERGFSGHSRALQALQQQSLLLQVRGLRYRYPGANRDTINGVSFAIPPGCRAALVGENGSGKSTIVKLLAGLYEPAGGEIVWRDSAGNAAGKLAAGESGGDISAVFQDFAKLQITLRENVALGNISALQDDSALQAALRDAGSKFGELDVQIGAPFGGIELSGGEWQKVATARALMRDARFIFFDEPTAALDPQAEKDAFALFMRITEGKSALLVTHRLGAAKLADIIFVLKAGKLVEQGAHAELMERNGEYSRMFRMQSSWYE